MNTIVKTLKPDEIEEEIIKQAGEILQRGGLVAFPTETVYGLGGDALNRESSQKIYAAKGRPSDNPLIVHVADFAAVEAITEDLPKEARLLSEAFWPGPLTMIVKKNDRVPYETTGGMDTVAIRMPNHPVALALIRESGGYVAGPSANTSGRPSPTRAEHVYEDLNGKIDMILDSGEVQIGLESTIIDLTEAEPMVLRPGYITPDRLEEVLGRPVRLDPGIVASDSKQKPKAPGMKYRHYAPKAEMMVVDGEAGQVIRLINRLAKADEAQGLRVGILATKESVGSYQSGVALSVGTRTSEETIARHLFDVLRDFDAIHVDRIYSESFETPQLGRAIMNRLLKAAGHKRIRAKDEGGGHETV